VTEQVLSTILGLDEAKTTSVPAASLALQAAFATATATTTTAARAATAATAAASTTTTAARAAAAAFPATTAAPASATRTAAAARPASATRTAAPAKHKVESGCARANTPKHTDQAVGPSHTPPKVPGAYLPSSFLPLSLSGDPSFLGSSSAPLSTGRASGSADMSN
jgi:hypothetical protein